MQLKATLCKTSTKKQLRNAYYKITPKLLFEYQCTSGKFIRLPNRSEKIDLVARIESNRNFFRPNWNARSNHETRDNCTVWTFRPHALSFPGTKRPQ